jgi:hypothetical protein
MSRTRRPPEKSPSERLRNTFFALYMREKPIIDFDIYYEDKMEKLINHYEKLLKQKDAFSTKRGL